MVLVRHGQPSGRRLQNFLVRGTSPTSFTTLMWIQTAQNNEGARFWTVGGTIYVASGAAGSKTDVFALSDGALVRRYDSGLGSAFHAHPQLIPVVKDGKTQYQLVSFSIYANDGYFVQQCHATQQSGCWGQTCVEDCGTYSGEEFASRPMIRYLTSDRRQRATWGQQSVAGRHECRVFAQILAGELPDATVAGTGVAAWFATPSSANLATALTGETGSGAAVFGMSPTLATPTINGGSLSSAVTTDDETYDDTNWNADTAPASKNAVRDKLNAMRVAIPFTSGNPDTSTADGEILYFGADINTVPASGTTTMFCHDTCHPVRSWPYMESGFAVAGERVE